MSIPVSTVLFAIRAGVKLYGAGRRAFADATKDKVLQLPLPKSDASAPDAALFWFTSSPVGKQAVEEIGDSSRLAALVKAAALTPDEEQELVEIYRAVRPLYIPEDAVALAPGEQTWDVATLGAVLTIRQWSKEAPADHPSPLQTVAGALVEIAVDYFVSTPGAVDEQRPEGRAIKAFLEAIDDTSFSETPLPLIAPGLFVALLDSVSAHPDLIAGGPKEARFVGEVTTSLSTSITAVLDADGMTEAGKTELLEQRWPELLARAFFEGGAQTILAHPTTYLGAKAGAESTVVGELISTFTGLVLTEDSLDLRAVLSSDGLETMVRAALTAVADNPGVIDLGEGNEGFEQVMVQVIAALPSRDHLFAVDLLPELVALVLEKTSANLPLILAHDGKDPRKNLVIVATASLLSALSDSSEQRWEPPLSQSQVLAIVEAALAEVVSNPAWLVRDIAGDDPVLNIALNAALASLAKVGDEHLSGELMVRTLQTSIAAVGANLILVKALPTPAQPGAEIALTQVLDLVFDQLLHKPRSAEIKWRLASAGALSAVIETALDALVRHDPSEAHIEVLQQGIEELVAGGIALDQLADILEQRLAA